ncbi:MAG: Rrf2 family transcriptional regulator [Verrucomicrobiae bacterium]|nr:Rrf2 family transcriptional regulator [Verrucomicrobiae bacterium]
MLSQKAKYGIRAMLHLAKHGQGKSVLIRDIAEKEKLPRKFLEIILLELKGAGILHSRPGKGGGYTLNRAPGTIPLSRIIRLIDGPLAMVSCVSHTGYAPCRDCLDERTCGIRAVMKKVRDATAQILDETTLGDLLEQERQLEQRMVGLDFHI